MTTFILLTFALLVCHFLADYVTVTPQMLAAKKHGTPVGPIAEHAMHHATGMALPLAVYCLWAKSPEVASVCILACFFQFFAHWGIDILKGRICKAYPDTYGNPVHPSAKFWHLFGLDQLAHQVVILIMVAMVIWYT